MNILLPLIGVGALAGVAYVGVEKAHLHFLFGIAIPYLAIVIFLGGMISRVLGWARSHVPFRITTTCGQQKSLPWIKSSPIEAPSSTLGVWLRMAFEVLTFRSLFRNTRAEVKEGGKKLVYGPTKWLWIGALVFHYSFLVIFVRHFKFFAEPVPAVVAIAGELDGFFQVGLPVLYLTDLAILAGLGFLLLRRLYIRQVRYISLGSDYFPLFLIIGVALTGILMRYFFKVDVVQVKALGVGLLSLSPKVPDPKLVNWPFYVHLTLVSALLAYLPFSKLTHMLGVFLSPTRNMANDNRARRHENSWDPALRDKVYPNWQHPHTYAEWQEDFKDKIEACGLAWDDTVGPPPAKHAPAAAAEHKE